MKKILFFNLDLLKKTLDENENHENRDAFLDYANQLCLTDSNSVVFISKDRNLLISYREHFYANGYVHFIYRTRAAAKEFIQNNKDRNNYFVFISGKEVDFRAAVNTGSLFIVPTWIPNEDKAAYYGVKVDTPKQLYNFIKTLNNQNNWFSKIEIQPNVTCLSLMDARYGYYAKNEEEKDMLLHFENLLKVGQSRNYYDILLYHFLAGITNTTMFDDIELFGMIPSSDRSLNQDIFHFMTQVRYIKKKQLPKKGAMKSENLLLRHTRKVKAHEKYQGYQRMNMGAVDEFSTLCINPEFKDKINQLRKTNKFNVCIFDDYMTHGNSFNAVRNMLGFMNVNKIIFVSLGSFAKPLQVRDYTLFGDIYAPGYDYILEKSEVINDISYNQSAKDEVAELYEIFNG